MLLRGTPCPFALLSPGQPRARSSAGLQSSSRCRQTTAENESRGLQRYAAIAEEDRQTEEVQLEGIDNNYCDEFICTSSPQVEQNIKALARDLLRLTTYTGSLYTKGVKYKDPYRSFEGIDKLQNQTYISQTVGKPKVLVQRMRMLDRGKAQIDWRLRGSVMAAQVDIDFQSDFTLDLITGRVTSMEERWSLDNCSASGKAFFNITRAAWSARQGVEDLKSGAGNLLNRVRGDQDDGSSQGASMSQGGAMDPTKFTQENDPTFQDGLTIITLLAIFYAMYKAYSTIFKV